MTLVFIILFGVLLTEASAQGTDDYIRQKVLQKSVIGRLFVFGKWNENGGTETHLRYLGKVITRKGHTYKIVNSIWIWGLSRRATSRVLIFNDRNQYIGNYYLTLVTDLPTQLKNGKLIFKNTDINCDKKQVTLVDFRNGIPKQFFRKCNGSGDIYVFDSN